MVRGHHKQFAPLFDGGMLGGQVSPAFGGGHSVHPGPNPGHHGACPMPGIALRTAPAGLDRLATIKWVNIHSRWYKSQFVTGVSPAPDQG